MTTVLGLLVIAGILYALQRLRVRHHEVVVPTTLFWREALEETRARVLVRRFRHPWAYVFVLLIAALLWLGFTEVLGGATDTGRATVFLLDGSAGMADRFDDEVARLERAVDAEPAGSVEVIFCGARPRPLLRPGEQPLLLSRRLRGLAPEPAPASIDGVIRELAAARSRPADVVVFGAAPVSPVTRDELPDGWTLVRSTPSAPAARRIKSLGVTEAASGAWDRVDVFFETDGSVPEVAGAFERDGAEYRQRDVPADGAVLRVRVGHEEAAVTLPDRALLRVALAPSLEPQLGALLRADPGVALVTERPDVAVLDAPGGQVPALVFVASADQSDAFLVRHDSDADATDVLLRALSELGLDDIDATGLASVAGRPVALGVAPAATRGIRVWRELLTSRFNFTGSRAFPLFVARALRWLANARPFPNVVAAGEPVPAARGPYTDPDGARLAAAGAVFTPLRAGAHRAADGSTLSVSLLDPAAVLDAPLKAGAGGEGGGAGWPAHAWLALIAFVLLLGEWFLFRTGRMP